MSNASILATYNNALARLKDARRAFAANKNPAKARARANQVATWEHIVNEMKKRYGFGATEKEDAA